MLIKFKYRSRCPFLEQNLINKQEAFLVKRFYFWSHFKNHLLEKKSNPIYKHWLTNIECLDLCQKDSHYQLILQAPSKLHKKWVQENILEDICYFFKKYYQDDLLKIQMEISPLCQLPSASESLTHNTSKQRKEFLFNPLYTFENFIPGQNSDLAYTSCLAAAQSKLAVDTMNPLFIYGPSGLGKTHLLNAIGQESLKKFPRKKVLYLSAERFLNEYITALQNKKMESFRNKFRKNCNLLLIDDIHILSRGQAVQEEFFHTFNELYNKKIQVVVCSDQPPHYIPSLQERIKTRLSGGLTADITYPNSETRFAILKNKMDLKKIFISPESLKAINKNCQRSIREMEGVLNRIKIMTEMNEGRLSFSELEKILQNNKKDLTIIEIKRKTTLYFKISLQELESPSRKKQIVKARQTAMYLIRKFLKKSLKDISRTFGKKDHTTVLNSIKKVEKLVSQDREFQTILHSLEQEIEKEYKLMC